MSQNELNKLRILRLLCCGVAPGYANVRFHSHKHRGVVHLGDQVCFARELGEKRSSKETAMFPMFQCPVATFQALNFQYSLNIQEHVECLDVLNAR